MTLNKLARKIKSLYFRQKLLENMPSLEEEIFSEVTMQEIRTLGGFVIEAKDGKVKLTPLPEREVRQLYLFDFVAFNEREEAL